MKKNFILLALFSALIFTGCTSIFTGDRDFRIQNNSSIDVNVSLSDGNSYSVKSGEYIDIVKAGGVTLSLVGNPRATVSKVLNGYNDLSYYYINDMVSYTYKVINKTSYNIVLSETNGLLGDNYGDTIDIPANDNSNDALNNYSPVTVKVYTSSPSWRAVYKDGTNTSGKTVNIDSDLLISQ